MQTKDRFFSCDWGTSSFRLRSALLPEGRIEREIQAPTGVQALHLRILETSGGFEAREAVFSSFLLEKWRALRAELSCPPEAGDVVVSGMASSSIGWRETPYARAPWPLDPAAWPVETFSIEAPEGRVRIHLVSGVRSDDDVMRGEETQVSGLLRSEEWKSFQSGCLLILPGTHSKHVRVQDGRLTAFRTHMTGELYQLLAERSILRESVGAQGPASGALDEEAFLEGLERATASGLSSTLFLVRTRSLLRGLGNLSNRSFLNGALLAEEFRGLDAEAQDAPILLAAGEPLERVYRLALERLGWGARLAVAPASETAAATVAAHAAWLRSRRPDKSMASL